MEKQQDWKKVLETDPTEWLLEQSEHLYKYYILREIMEKPEEDTEVRTLRNAMVDEILGKQMDQQPKPETKVRRTWKSKDRLR